MATSLVTKNGPKKVRNRENCRNRHPFRGFSASKTGFSTLPGLQSLILYKNPTLYDKRAQMGPDFEGFGAQKAHFGPFLAKTAPMRPSQMVGNGCNWGDGPGGIRKGHFRMERGREAVATGMSIPRSRQCPSSRSACVPVRMELWNLELRNLKI